MALIEEPQTGWLFNILMAVVSGLSMIAMTLIGLVWKNQAKEIEDMKAAHAIDIRDIREDVEAKHTENREDFLLIHKKIEENDRRAQDRHNDLMRYLRDRPSGLQERS